MTETPHFSFEEHPELVMQVDEAFRQITKETDDPANTLASVLGNVAAKPIKPEQTLSDEVKLWADSQIGSAINNLAVHFAPRPLYVPRTPAEIQATHPSYTKTLNHLYYARIAIANSAGIGEDNILMIEKLNLVLIPWQAFRLNLEHFREYYQSLQMIQSGKSQHHTPIQFDLADLETEDAVYKNPINNKQTVSKNPNYRPLLSAKEYLDLRIKRDGPWGIMLTQTSPEPTMLNHVVQLGSVDDITNQGRNRIRFAKQNIDGMGIFEWLSLLLQESPSNFAQAGVTTLLANRILREDMGGLKEYVPRGIVRNRVHFADQISAESLISDDDGMRFTVL